MHMKYFLIISLLIINQPIFSQESKFRFSIGLDYLRTIKANNQSFDHNKIAPHIILNKERHSFGIGTTFSKRNYLTEYNLILPNQADNITIDGGYIFYRIAPNNYTKLFNLFFETSLNYINSLIRVKNITIDNFHTIQSLLKVGYNIKFTENFFLNTSYGLGIHFNNASSKYKTQINNIVYLDDKISYHKKFLSAALSIGFEYKL